MAKLKVFAAHQGFFETVVAAPSQKAALEAWGTRQNLFAEGMADVTQEPKAVEAALAKPGVVLRRAAGSGGAFSAEGGEIVLPPPPPPKNGARARGPSAKRPSPVKPPPDRRALDVAETTVERAQARHDREAAVLRRELETLQRRLAEAEDEARRDLTALRKAVERERAAYRKAGGE